jgi:murein DD-endopeptidase MepM/ murein hydrolase activator NlpD
MRTTGAIWGGVACFLLGVVTTVLVLRGGPVENVPVVIPETPASPGVSAAGSPGDAPAVSSSGESISAAPAPRDCTDIARAIATADVRTPPSPSDAIAYLRHRTLALPLPDLEPRQLRSSFAEKRSGSRAHEAMDILAPRHTPVLAVDDGCVAKLFESKAGGLTIYQFDPTLTYTYYYAHLERYADDIDAGDPLRRGEVIGFVGTSGNAPPDTPHLHFAIFITGVEKRWWEGTPIDPFEVWRPDTPSPTMH